MLNSVFIKLTVNRLKKETADIFLDELVSEVLVKTEVCKVAATLSVLVEVLCVLEHNNHEVNSVWRGNFRVAVEYLCYVSQASCCVEHCLRVFCLLSKLDNGLNDVCLNAVVLNSIGVLSLVKKLLVGLVVFQDKLKAFGDLSEQESVDFTLLVRSKAAVVAADV
jgi:hypothetical protein